MFLNKHEEHGHIQCQPQLKHLLQAVSGVLSANIKNFIHLVGFLLPVILVFLQAPATAGDSNRPKAYVDGTGPHWRALDEDDFTIVNGRPDTWQFEGNQIRTTGKPHGVMRTNKKLTNFEMVVEWKFLEPAGDAGVFVWVPETSVDDLEPGEWPDGIEINIVDPEFKEARKRAGKSTDFFTAHGDVFPVGDVEFTPFEPTSPNGSRSFPSKKLVKPAGNWNHYYLRMINGEIRVWVNGEEVSGGNEASPRTGYMTLQAEGTPILYRNVRIRELP